MRWVCMVYDLFCVFFFFKQKTAYEMRISDWSSDVCSSDLDLARMVSLNPCIDAILLEVADPSQVLAISQLSHDPRYSWIAPGTARRFKAVSATVEEVAALDPDMVLAGWYLGTATSEALTASGYRNATTGVPGQLTDR